MLMDIDVKAFLEKKKKGRGFLVLATGSSCCGRKEVFLPGLVKLCEEKKTKIKIHNVGDKVFGFIWGATRIDIPPENILPVNKLAMSCTQYGIFKDLCHQLLKDLEEYDVVIVNLHTRFLWWQGSVSIPIYNEPFINELLKFGLKPDLLVCFIDNARDIVERLNKSSQWRNQNLSEADAWKWQNEEVNATKGYLFLTDERINFFVIPVMQPPETMYYILFEPWRPIIYAQMPISNIKAGKLKKVIWFINELRKEGIVFDPLTVETGVVERAEFDRIDENRDIIVRHMQTGYRDDEWFIPQCGISISFHVELVFTFGVVDETVHVAQLGREPWSIFPGDLSPFQPFRIYYKRIFETPEACLKFFRKEYMPVVYKKWEIKRKKEIE